MKAREIMTREVISVSADTNAQEALELLWKMQISGLPVIDKDGKLLGMFTEKEILIYVLPSYVEKVGRFIYQGNPKAIMQKALVLRGLKVKDLMRKEVISVDEDTTLSEIARLMLTQKSRRFPVLNKAKEVVGIISRGDIVKVLFASVSI